MRKIIYSTIIVVCIIGFFTPIVNIKHERTIRPPAKKMLLQLHQAIVYYENINNCQPETLNDLYMLEHFATKVEKLKESRIIQSLDAIKYEPSALAHEAVLTFTGSDGNGSVKTYALFSDGMVKVIK
jgi:hypothetical protein